MRTLVVCMLLHELRIVQPLALGQWPKQLQLQQPLDAKPYFEQYDDMESSWRNSGKLFDQPMDQQKRIDIAVPHWSEPPTRIRVDPRSTCFCESWNEVNDLGEGYYPRNLIVRRCKPISCHSRFHFCSPQNYTVQVLRERDARESQLDDDMITETPLPKCLRQKWELIPVTVVVACVPILANKKN